MLERALEIGREYDVAMSGDDEERKERAREALRKVTSELEPEFGCLRDEESPQCYSEFEKWTNESLESTHRSIQEWLDGRSEIYYHSPSEFRPTSGDLREVEDEMRKRGLL